MGRRWLTPEDAADLGRLDPEAIARVREEAWPAPENADEMHDALVWLGFLAEAEVGNTPGWAGWLGELAASRRAARLRRAGRDAVGRRRAAAAVPGAVARCDARAGDRRAGRLCRARVVARSRAGRDRARASRRSRPGRCRGAGGTARPCRRRRRRAARRARSGGLRPARPVHPGADERRVVRAAAAGAHPPLHGRPPARRDRAGRGARLPALPARVAARGARTRMEGPDSLAAIVGQLEGFEAAAGAWESEILPARLSGYDPDWLDDLCLVGPRRLGAAAAAQPAARRCRARRDTGAIDADHPARPPQRRAVDAAVAGRDGVEPAPRRAASSR